MNTPREVTSADDAADLSLTVLRISAAVGFAVSISLIVIGFGWSIWWGAGAVFVAPVIPLVLVAGVDAIRR